MRPHSTTLLAILAIVALAVLSDGLRASAHERREAAQTYEDIYYLPPPGWLRVFSLGWNEALADLIWMRALVYFGDEFQQAEGSVRHVFDYAEAIATLDPHFLAIYRWVGVAGLYRPTAISTDDIERSVAFMERGARLYPASGELAWDIGAALVFELPPMLEDEGAQLHARERGMPYLLTASRLGAAPEWMALTNASLLGQLGRTEQAVRQLEEAYLRVDDPAMRTRIAARIASLRERSAAEAFVAAAQEQDEARQRDFPYLAPGLYHLVGPRAPVDRVSPVREGLARAYGEPDMPAEARQSP